MDICNSIGTIFINNTNIVSFNEFNLFTNCKTLSGASENFGECTNLKSIDLSNITLLSSPNSRGGFENCTSLNNVILNNNLDAIGFRAFFGCTSLVNINIPNTVTVIYSQAFNSCLNLTSVGDLSNVTKIYSVAFQNCKKLIDINLSNVEYIERQAFVSASITSVVMPKVKTLSTGTGNNTYGAFYNCSKLLTCDFGEYVESVGSGLLNKCISLKYIIFRTITPPTMSTYTFDNTNNCPIYVPDDSVSAYQTATNWSAYSSRIKPLSEFTE